jgi:hypothetical protein
VLDERTEQAPVQGADHERGIDRKTSHKCSKGRSVVRGEEIFTTINLEFYND